MEFRSFKRKIDNFDEVKAYIDTLPEDMRDAAQQMLDNLQPRMLLAEALTGLLIALCEKYPKMKEDSMFALATVVAMSATTNIDDMIMSTLQQEGVLTVIEKILAEQERLLKDSVGDSTISDILKGFKLSDN